jgi:geranylgeranyl diphosphate synthase type II
MVPTVNGIQNFLVTGGPARFVHETPIQLVKLRAQHPVKPDKTPLPIRHAFIEQAIPGLFTRQPEPFCIPFKEGGAGHAQTVSECGLVAAGRAGKRHVRIPFPLAVISVGRRQIVTLGFVLKGALPLQTHPEMPAKSAAAFDLSAWVNANAKAVDRALDGFLPKPSVKPATIHKAMRYSLFAGGKRMRPALVLAAAEACGGNPEEALPLACAVECIHTYSLIHDDLPAMDNDDFRRGKPTNHKVFGEGIAVLAGDALLTQAFEIAAQCRTWPRYDMRAVILDLAVASGSLQLIAGQVADLEGEGKKLSVPQLRYIHERKTSALLCCSVRLGGMSANCTPAQLKALTDFGYHVGLAFQVIDDILDVTQTTEKLGKTAGKDVATQKATYPRLVGLEKSKKIARELTDKAFGALKPFKGKAVALEALAKYLLERDR